MAYRSALINVMTQAARKAARGLVRDFGEIEQLQVSKKGPADFVSAADLRAEEVLRRELQKARPTFGLRMEESGETAGSDREFVWVVDPLDGTTNFLHGIPHFAISIGLERAGQPVAGVIYDPVKDEMFWAENGQGAHLNDHRLRVSSRSKLTEAVLATGIPFHGRAGHENFLAELAAVAAAVAGILRVGAAAPDLAPVAARRYEGLLETGLSRWDISAGLLLVREAGGLVSEIDGGNKMLESGSVLAANASLHEPIRTLLRRAKQRP